MSRLERAIVTTGGTREPLDSVRFITNFSTGRFGIAIAESLARRGYLVNVLCPPDVRRTLGEGADFSHKVFTSASSLRQVLLGQPKPAIVFHAAAVADFTPKEPVSGKIPSSQKELVLTLVRTPKILDELRAAYGQESFLVGFKLLSGVSRPELIQAAVEQNSRAHLNLTVANDSSNLHDGMHPVILVTAEGGAINLAGQRQDVADNIVEFVRKRSLVTWYHSERSDTLPAVSQDDTAKFAELLGFAQKTHLLYDSSGNVSMRIGNNAIMVTPRQVDKSVTRPEEACRARVNHEVNVVEFEGVIKPSIDTAVNDALYRAFPGIKYMLHFHTPWGLSPNVTSFPYPCGVKEEASEILRILGQVDREEFSIELLHHGFLIGLSENGLEKLKVDWESIVLEFREHLTNIGLSEFFDRGRLRPIFADTRIVGVLANGAEEAAVYLGEQSRGKGVGRKVAEQLLERQIKIRTVDECGVLDFYRRFKFLETRDSSSGTYIFTPPQITETDPLFSRISEWLIP